MAWWFAAPIVLWGAKKVYDAIAEDNDPDSENNITKTAIGKAKARRTRYRKQKVREALKEYRKRLVCDVSEIDKFYEAAVYNEKKETVTIELSEKSYYLSQLKLAVHRLGGSFEDSEDKVFAKFINSGQVAKFVLEAYSKDNQGKSNLNSKTHEAEGFNTNWDYVPEDDSFNRELVMNLKVLSDELKNSEG